EWVGGPAAEARAGLPAHTIRVQRLDFPRRERPIVYAEFVNAAVQIRIRCDLRAADEVVRCVSQVRRTQCDRRIFAGLQAIDVDIAQLSLVAAAKEIQIVEQDGEGQPSWFRIRAGKSGFAQGRNVPSSGRWLCTTHPSARFFVTEG